MLNRPEITDGDARQIPRRDALRQAALGYCGSTLPAYLASAQQTTQAASRDEATMPGFGRAKQCLLLYIYGAWSQLDTFDPKPEAPSEIRGEFGVIDSRLPELSICEHLPRTAQILDRCTLIRSMAHPWNIHSAAYTLTGNPDTERIEGRQRHPDQWPYLGSVMDYLCHQGHFGRAAADKPANVMLPWRQSLYARPNKRAGTFGGFLGTGYDPLWTEFRGEAPLGDPFRAITPEGRFLLGASGRHASTAARTEHRRALLHQFEKQFNASGASSAGRNYERNRQRAFELLADPGIHDALRIDREPAALREDYGMTLFGQACLAARRLLETGVKFVTVVWDEYGQTDESWDTHHDHHSRMKQFLLPAFDRAYSSLLLDLDRRGMLKDTLVLCLSEHGRTPQFYATSAGAPGRGHWSRAYSQLFAGAGVPRGRVVGTTDATAADVTQRPINPKDILSTAYHLLGVDHQRELTATPGRSVPLVRGGQVVPELLS